MEYNCLITHQEGKTGFITLNRPKFINALTSDSDRELKEALSVYGDNDQVRAVVLRGKGDGFCAGHDFNEMKGNLGVLDFREIFGGLHDVINLIISLDKPVIAAVHGVVAAGGFLLASMCDLVVCSSDAQFSTPGINFGLTCFSPMLAFCQYAHRRKALELALTGESIGAEEAQSIGLVNRVVQRDKLDEEAKKLADKVAEKSPVSVKLGKMFFHVSAGMQFSNALEYAREMLSINAMCEDFEEGLNAFSEKRKPRWHGK